MRKRKVERADNDEAIALAKATIRAAERLGISQKVLASVIGLSEPTISRMRIGSFLLKRGNGKSFELAQLLIQLHSLLDRMVAGDDNASKAWLRGENLALQARPIELIQSVQGLVNVVSYLRMRLASKEA